MTESQYCAAVTEHILGISGPDFVFPTTAEADFRACFLRRIAPPEAAAKLIADWADTEPPCTP